VAALRFVQQNRNDESAQTMAEYGVVLAVISMIVVAALTLLGTSAAISITRFANFLTF
jgi:Flp pilus assembly pilin Flp